MSRRKQELEAEMAQANRDGNGEAWVLAFLEWLELVGVSDA